MPVLADVVASIFDSCAVFKPIFTLGRCWTSAVTADINGATESRDFVLGDIVHAGRMDEAIGHGILINLGWVSTVARTTSLAVNDHLGIETNWSGC